MMKHCCRSEVKADTKKVYLQCLISVIKKTNGQSRVRI